MSTNALSHCNLLGRADDSQPEHARVGASDSAQRILPALPITDVAASKAASELSIKSYPGTAGAASGSYRSRLHRASHLSHAIDKAKEIPDIAFAQGLLLPGKQSVAQVCIASHFDMKGMTISLAAPSCGKIQNLSSSGDLDIAHDYYRRVCFAYISS